MFDNGSANEICEKVYGIKKPDFSDLNMILSSQLNSLLYPTLGNSGVRNFKPLHDVTELLLLDPAFKFINLKFVPQMPLESKSFSVESWEALESRVVQMMLGGSIEAKINWRIKTHSGKLVISNPKRTP